MRKILHILTDSNFGGAGRYLINFLQEYDRSRFEMNVILPKNSQIIPIIREMGVDVIEVEGIADRSFSLGAIWALRKLIRKENPDMVHTHGSFSGRIAAKSCGKKVVFTRHCAFAVPSYLRKGPGKWAYGLLNCALADRIIAIGPATADNLKQSGVRENMISVMMNGCGQLQRCEPQVIAEKKREFNIPDGVFVIGMLARIEPYKGHRIMLDAAKAALDEGKELVIIIAGTGSEERGVEEYISEMGLQEHVRMLGFVENVAEVLSLLDVQINCSYESETSSLSIIEGMSMGVPAIASACSGNPWLIEDGVSGLLFRNKDSVHLKEQLCRLMDDENLLCEMKKNALRAYKSRFTGEAFANSIETVYDRVLNG